MYDPSGKGGRGDMPSYTYQASGERRCSACEDGFEVLLSFEDDPVEECPECGAPVERRFTAPNINTRPSTKTILSDANLKNKGFTKLVNEGGGKFRKI